VKRTNASSARINGYAYRVGVFLGWILVVAFVAIVGVFVALLTRAAVLELERRHLLDLDEPTQDFK